MAVLSFAEICYGRGTTLGLAEQRNFTRLRSSLGTLSMSQAKVQQLYKLDRLLQEESGTLHSLQQDKVSIGIYIVTMTAMLIATM